MIHAFWEGGRGPTIVALWTRRVLGWYVRTRRRPKQTHTNTHNYTKFINIFVGFLILIGKHSAGAVRATALGTLRKELLQVKWSMTRQRDIHRPVWAEHPSLEKALCLWCGRSYIDFMILHPPIGDEGILKRTAAREKLRPSIMSARKTTPSERFDSHARKYTSLVEVEARPGDRQWDVFFAVVK